MRYNLISLHELKISPTPSGEDCGDEPTEFCDPLENFWFVHKQIININVRRGTPS